MEVRHSPFSFHLAGLIRRQANKTAPPQAATSNKMVGLCTPLAICGQAKSASLTGGKHSLNEVLDVTEDDAIAI